MATVLVSESTIVLSALERCLQDRSEMIQKVARLSELTTPMDWLNTSIIFDMAHLDRGIRELVAFGAPRLARCVVLARQTDDLARLAPLMGLVGAIVLDSCSLEDVAQTAQMVGNGHVVLPVQMREMLNRTPGAGRNNFEAIHELTDRENTVLALLTEGCSNKVIARKLEISDSTVRVHVRSVMRKLGVQNRTQAALAVLERRNLAPRATLNQPRLQP